VRRKKKRRKGRTALLNAYRLRTDRLRIYRLFTYRPTARTVSGGGPFHGRAMGCGLLRMATPFKEQPIANS